jgi:peptidoglycan/LPS O-acetylase OafA/YrhL
MQTLAKPAFKLGYRPSLNGLRTFAVLAVMAMHAGLPFAKGGTAGVDLFFVLSGFLITAILIEEWDGTGTVSLKRFYLRRILRLLPAAFAMLGLYAIYARFFETEAEAANTFRFTKYALAYVANWARAFRWSGHPALGHMWSLSVEEQFYIIWPLALIAMLRVRIDRRVILGLLILAICAVAANRALLWHGPDSFARTYNGLDTRADALLAGCAVALIASLGWLPVRPLAIQIARIVAAAGAVLLIYFVVVGPSREAYMRLGLATAIAVGAAAGLISLLSNPPVLFEKLLAFPVIDWIGSRLSYGLYLWHLPVFYIIGSPAGWHPLAVQLVRFAAAFALALASYYAIERPVLRLKDRLSH